LAGALAAGAVAGVAPAGFAAAGVPGVPDGGLPTDDGADLGGGAPAETGGNAPLAPGVGFGASPSLPALGGAFGSSAISGDACGKAPFYGQRKHEFSHIADKRVNREQRQVVLYSCAAGLQDYLASRLPRAKLGAWPIR
jgi:hypothetical protein